MTRTGKLIFKLVLVLSVYTKHYFLQHQHRGHWSMVRTEAELQIFCCKFLDAALLNFETQVMDDEIAKCVIDIIY